MPDISMCSGTWCPLDRNKCYRYRAVPDSPNQWWAAFDERAAAEKNFVTGCDAFWPIEKGMRLRPKNAEGPSFYKSELPRMA